MTEYTAETTNSTNKVTATPVSSDATVAIELNGEELENEGSAEWDEGENTLTIDVTGDDGTTTYTVTVTKS